MLKYNPVPVWVALFEPSLSVEKFSYAHSEFMFANLVANRKNFALADSDLLVFFYLVMLSRRRIFINLTTSELAEKINMSQVKVSQSLKALKTLNLCKRIQHGEYKGFIIHPEIINNGDDKKRAFKFMLWDRN
jgi:DNA-binding transcriptional ArsR family regulator